MARADVAVVVAMAADLSVRTNEWCKFAEKNDLSIFHLDSNYYSLCRRKDWNFKAASKCLLYRCNKQIHVCVRECGVCVCVCVCVKYGQSVRINTAPQRASALLNIISSRSLRIDGTRNTYRELSKRPQTHHTHTRSRHAYTLLLLFLLKRIFPTKKKENGQIPKYKSQCASLLPPTSLSLFFPLPLQRNTRIENSALFPPPPFYVRCSYNLGS